MVNGPMSIFSTIEQENEDILQENGGISNANAAKGISEKGTISHIMPLTQYNNVLPPNFN